MDMDFYIAIIMFGWNCLWQTKGLNHHRSLLYLSIQICLLW